MSAVEEYREECAALRRHDLLPAWVTIQLADAAIVELEAEFNRMSIAYVHECARLRIRAEQAEAEVADYKDRYEALTAEDEWVAEASYDELEAELAALKEDLKHLHSRWDYTQYWFANLYPVDWDRCQERYNTTKTGARAEEGGGDETA